MAKRNMRVYGFIGGLILITGVALAATAVAVITRAVVLQ